MTWDEYYVQVYGRGPIWKAVQDLDSLTEIGPKFEVIQMMGLIAPVDMDGADKLLRMAIASGMKFTMADLQLDMEKICSREAWMGAMYASIQTFDERDLKSVRYILGDEKFTEAVKRYHLILPTEMRESIEADRKRKKEREAQETLWKKQQEARAFEEEIEETWDNLSYLIGEADYALECLQRTYDNLTYAVVNGITEHQSERRGHLGSYWSRNKYEYAEAADAELEAAEEALSNLSVELQQWSTSQRQRLNFDRRIKTLDVWSSNSLSGAIHSENIRRTWRQLEKTIPEVRAIRDELQRTYEELSETYERYQTRQKLR